MLTTCGRVEIYAEVADYELGTEQLKPYMYTLLGREAALHLFRVGSGLDSMLVGEAEILGQVKDTYVRAQRANSVGPVPHKLFRDAIGAGKTARSKPRSPRTPSASQLRR